MMGYYKLPLRFDPQKMLAELEALESRTVWLTHPDYTVAQSGTWTAIALVSTDGDHTGAESLRYHGGARAERTELLRTSPYLSSVVDAFHAKVHRVRLMNLKPGTRISEHRDYGAQRYSVERGYVRVHIPVRTHPKVAWRSRGVIVPMREGEPWYVNVCLPHSVENESDVNRVHMVLDMEVNDWFLSLLPPRSATQRLAGTAIRVFEPSLLAAKAQIDRPIARTRQWLGDIGLRSLRDRLRRLS